MPKPILSDSLFNAEDVAEAILAKANLQITNNNLGVTDITNKFVLDSNVTGDSTNNRAYYFNGFVFMDFVVVKQNVPSVTSFDIMTINDSDYYPNVVYRTNSISFQLDSVNCILIQTNGVIEANSVYVPSGGDASFRININCWYRTN